MTNKRLVSDEVIAEYLRTGKMPLTFVVKFDERGDFINVDAKPVFYDGRSVEIGGGIGKDYSRLSIETTGEYGPDDWERIMSALRDTVVSALERLSEQAPVVP